MADRDAGTAESHCHKTSCTHEDCVRLPNHKIRVYTRWQKQRPTAETAQPADWRTSHPELTTGQKTLWDWT